jgi:hypothetical protein
MREEAEKKPEAVKGEKESYIIYDVAGCLELVVVLRLLRQGGKFNIEFFECIGDFLLPTLGHLVNDLMQSAVLGFFLKVTPPLADNKLVQCKGLGFGNIESKITVLDTEVISSWNVHEMQFLGNDVQIAEAMLLFFGLCAWIGQELKGKIRMNEFGKARLVHYGGKAPLVKDCGNINRMCNFNPSRDEDIGIFGSGDRNIKCIFILMTIKLLTPTTDKDYVLKHADVLQVFEDRVKYLKFFFHGAPFQPL